MRQGHDGRGKGVVILGTLLGVVLSAAPALASVSTRVPEPGSLTLLAVGAGLVGAISLGRSWRKRREAKRRRDDR